MRRLTSSAIDIPAIHLIDGGVSVDILEQIIRAPYAEYCTDRPRSKPRWAVLPWRHHDTKTAQYYFHYSKNLLTHHFHFGKFPIRNDLAIWTVVMGPYDDLENRYDGPIPSALKEAARQAHRDPAEVRAEALASAVRSRRRQWRRVRTFALKSLMLRRRAMRDDSPLLWARWRRARRTLLLEFDIWRHFAARCADHRSHHDTDIGTLVPVAAE